MTEKSTVIDKLTETAARQVAMLNVLFDVADRMAPTACEYFDLAIAMPGLVLSFHIGAFDLIDAAQHVSADLKDATKRRIKENTARMLKMVLAAIESDNPRKAMIDQQRILNESLKMGMSHGGVQ